MKLLRIIRNIIVWVIVPNFVNEAKTDLVFKDGTKLPKDIINTVGLFVDLNFYAYVLFAVLSWIGFPQYIYFFYFYLLLTTLFILPIFARIFIKLFKNRKI